MPRRGAAACGPWRKPPTSQSNDRQVGWAALPMVAGRCACWSRTSRPSAGGSHAITVREHPDRPAGGRQPPRHVPDEDGGVSHMTRWRAAGRRTTESPTGAKRQPCPATPPSWRLQSVLMRPPPPPPCQGGAPATPHPSSPRWGEARRLGGSRGTDPKTACGTKDGLPRDGPRAGGADGGADRRAHRGPCQRRQPGRARRLRRRGWWHFRAPIERPDSLVRGFRSGADLLRRPEDRTVGLRPTPAGCAGRPPSNPPRGKHLFDPIPAPSRWEGEPGAY